MFPRKTLLHLFVSVISLREVFMDGMTQNTVMVRAHCNLFILFSVFYLTYLLLLK